MHPAFIDGAKGQLFTLYFAPGPETPAKGGLLFIPPFGEELNRSRHMIVKTARALSESGWGVLLLDLYGTGDSAGEFSQARWDIWKDDIRMGADHLKALGHQTVGLWAMRTGCLLAAEVLEGTPYTQMIFWQPVLKGKTFLNQFIRVGLAASLTRGAEGGSRELRERLMSGQAVEIAGYMLHPELAGHLEAAAIPAGQPWPHPLHCIEVASAEGAVSPALEKAVASWTENGAKVTVQAVAGPQFWMLQEPEWADELTAATVRALESGA